VVPGGACDIEVNPRRVACKFADEPCAGDGAAALAAADVLNVGEAAFDEFAILVVHRKLPHFFAGGFGGGEELVGPALVGAAEDADVDIGESDDDGAGERGGVDEMGRAQLLGVVDGVGEDEAALGVSVEDFDRLARHGGLDVAGLLRAATGHVFRGGDYANYFDIWLQRGKSANDAEHGGAASHVVFHFFHAVGGLDGDAAGVEGYGFADEADHRRAGLGVRGGIGDDDDAGRLDAALRHAEQR